MVIIVWSNDGDKYRMNSSLFVLHMPNGVSILMPQWILIDPVWTQFDTPGVKTLADLLIVIFIPFSPTLDIEFGEHNKWRNMLCGFELGFIFRTEKS